MSLKKEKLLIYAHYYIPDVASTGQILKELAEGMLDAFDITIICVVPSYSGKVDYEYKTKMFYKEEINGVEIIRIRVPEFSKKNKISRVKNIFAYFVGAMIATFKVGKVKYVYSISQPPILGGLLGVWGKWMKKAKYIYNIQDYNPEQIMAVKYSENKLILKIMMSLDKFSCRKADKVIVVGRDMIETLKERFRNQKVPKSTFINNWIDEEEIFPLNSDNKQVLSFKKQYNLQNKFVIMYSGNIGLYYDLENIIKVIGKFKDEQEIVFAFVGEGTVRDKLLKFKQKNMLSNVIFIPYQNKSDLNYSLNAGDVHWVVNAKGIRGVSVPSKLYGVMAAGKPVIGVLEKDSEARMIIEETECGFVTDPGNYEGVEKIIRYLIDNKDTPNLSSAGIRGRMFLEEHLTKDVSVKKYIKEIKDCGSGK